MNKKKLNNRILTDINLMIILATYFKNMQNNHIEYSEAII